MARKKKEESGGGGSPAWMATFSDLMNLLLCFFVLLFAFSSVDAEKFAELAASFNSSFSILSGGATAIGDGNLVSQGVSQMDYFSEYYSEMGLEAGKGSNSGEADTNKEETVATYEAAVEAEQKKATETLYEAVVVAAEEKELQDTLDISTDPNNQFVRITLSGAILFDSGRDLIRKEAEPMMDKMGDILKTYDRHLIKIEGHTDNVPIHNGNFQSNMWLSTARATKVFEYLTQKKKLNPKTLEASGRGEFEPIATNNTVEGRSKNRRVEIKIYTEMAN